MDKSIEHGLLLYNQNIVCVSREKGKMLEGVRYESAVGGGRVDPAINHSSVLLERTAPIHKALARSRYAKRGSRETKE